MEITSQQERKKINVTDTVILYPDNSIKGVKQGNVLAFEWVVGKSSIKSNVKEGFFEVTAFKVRSQHPKILGINTVKSETSMCFTDIKSRNILIKHLVQGWSFSVNHSVTFRVLSGSNSDLLVSQRMGLCNCQAFSLTSRSLWQKQ